MNEPGESIVELDGAAPVPPRDRRDRAVLGALAAGCIAIGAAVFVVRAPAPLARPAAATPPSATTERPSPIIFGPGSPGTGWFRFDRSGVTCATPIPAEAGRDPGMSVRGEICFFRSPARARP